MLRMLISNLSYVLSGSLQVVFGGLIFEVKHLVKSLYSGLLQRLGSLLEVKLKVGSISIDIILRS
jgi:hypothetical protein